MTPRCSIGGVNRLDHARQDIRVGRGQNAVAEVEHVALRSPSLGDDPAHLPFDNGRPEHSRIEVALQRLPGTRRAASSSGTRQSTPTTSAPAAPISASSSPVPTPKWMRGTPRSATADGTECCAAARTSGTRPRKARRPRSRRVALPWLRRLARRKAPEIAAILASRSSQRSGSACMSALVRSWVRDGPPSTR